MYRPEGWKDIPCDTCKDVVIDDYGYVCELTCGERARYFNFEAGADAMLEGLRNQTLAEKQKLDFNNCTVVFIPEEGASG